MIPSIIHVINAQVLLIGLCPYFVREAITCGKIADLIILIFGVHWTIVTCFHLESVTVSLDKPSNPWSLALPFRSMAARVTPYLLLSCLAHGVYLAFNVPRNCGVLSCLSYPYLQGIEPGLFHFCNEPLIGCLEGFRFQAVRRSSVFHFNEVFKECILQ